MVVSPSSELPNSIAAWHDLDFEHPTVLVKEEGEYVYYLINFGPCAPAGTKTRELGAATIGTGGYSLWMSLTYPNWLNRAQKPSPCGFARIATTELERIDWGNLVIQRRDRPI